VRPAHRHAAPLGPTSGTHLATYRATGSATPTTTEFMPPLIGSISYGGDNRQTGPRRPGKPRAKMSVFTRER
jgi:hypothetical protein